MTDTQFRTQSFVDDISQYLRETEAAAVEHRMQIAEQQLRQHLEKELYQDLILARTYIEFQVRSDLLKAWHLFNPSTRSGSPPPPAPIASSRVPSPTAAALDRSPEIGSNTNTGSGQKRVLDSEGTLRVGPLKRPRTWLSTSTKAAAGAGRQPRQPTTQIAPVATLLDRFDLLIERGDASVILKVASRVRLSQPLSAQIATDFQGYLDLFTQKTSIDLSGWKPEEPNTAPGQIICLFNRIHHKNSVQRRREACESCRIAGRICFQFVRGDEHPHQRVYAAPRPRSLRGDAAPEDWGYWLEKEPDASEGTPSNMATSARCAIPSSNDQLPTP